MKKIFPIILGSIVIISIFILTRSADTSKANSQSNFTQIRNANISKILAPYNIGPSAETNLKQVFIPALDTLFDCINLHTILTYYEISSTEEFEVQKYIDCLLPSQDDLPEDVTVTTEEWNKIYLSEVKYLSETKSEKISLKLYIQNLPKVICADFIINAEGNIEKIPPKCNDILPINEFAEGLKEFEEEYKDNLDLLLCHYSSHTNLIKPFEEDKAHFICTAEEFYKEITDRIKKLRNDSGNYQLEISPSGQIETEQKMAIATYETTQLKVIQRMKLFPLEIELQKFENNIVKVNTFFRELEPIFNAFTYIFPNASTYCN